MQWGRYFDFVALVVRPFVGLSVDGGRTGRTKKTEELCVVLLLCLGLDDTVCGGIGILN